MGETKGGGERETERLIEGDYANEAGLLKSAYCPMSLRHPILS